MRFLAPTIFIYMLATTAVYALSAQSGSKPQFEVASIKSTNPSANGGVFKMAPGRLTVTGATLKQCIVDAYELKNYEVIGGPAWADLDRFDISAKMSESDGVVANGPERRAQILVRLQSLLAERFQLETHRETRNTSLYQMVISKSGFKLKETPGAGKTSAVLQITPEKIRIVRKNTSMTQLADLLSRHLSHPVINKTNIAGSFDFTLEWAPEGNPYTQYAQKPPDGGNPRSQEEAPSIPALSTELREQLGLELKKATGAIEVVVIDAARKPTEN